MKVCATTFWGLWGLGGDYKEGVWSIRLTTKANYDSVLIKVVVFKVFDVDRLRGLSVIVRLNMEVLYK